MFDGVVCTLTNVRFIPDMRKNLISLGTLDAKGHTLNAQDGVFWVYVGDKTIIQGLRHRSGHRNLYVLEGTTICGKVHATISRRKMAHVWHSRLGHMSDRYMTMLHEKELLSGLGKPSPRRVEDSHAPRCIEGDAPCCVEANQALRRVEANQALRRVEDSQARHVEGEAPRQVEVDKAPRHVEPKYKINLKFYEHCVIGKQNRKPFGVGTHSSKEFLGYVHSDVWGPSCIASLSGKWYYVSFIDDYSRFTWVYFLKERSDVFETFKGWRAQVETQTRT